MSGFSGTGMGAPVTGEQPYDQELANNKSRAYSALWGLEEERDIILDAYNEASLPASNLSEAGLEPFYSNLDIVDEQIELVQETIKNLEKSQPATGSVPPTGMHCG